MTLHSIIPAVLVASALLAQSRPSVDVRETAPKASADLVGVVATLDSGLAGDDAALAAAARDVASRLGPAWMASRRLETALTQEANLRETVRKVREQLAFKPLIEAPTPPGWPVYTPVDEVELKRYPAYRAAYTQRNVLLFRESRRFWTLFNHIKDRDIPMTAPVEMGMRQKGDAGGYEEVSMGFLYPNSDTGAPGETDGGTVIVKDVPPMTVVSAAMRGRPSDEAMTLAYDRLREWADASPEWKLSGETRVLGWNSPSVPESRSYWEIQAVLERR